MRWQVTLDTPPYRPDDDLMTSDKQNDDSATRPLFRVLYQEFLKIQAARLVRTY